MTASEIITLVAALMALLGSMLSLFIASRLALNKERRQLLWSKELDRFHRLEELAGSLLEDLGRYRPLERLPDLVGRIEAIELAAGQFARYPSVRQSIRDFHNRIAILWDNHNEGRDHRESRHEAEVAFKELLAVCDTIVGRKESSKI